MKNLNGKIVNLTPHDIRLLDKATDETLEVIPFSGTIARVAEENDTVGTLNGVPIVAKKFTSIEGLPKLSVLETQTDPLQLTDATLCLYWSKHTKVGALCFSFFFNQNMKGNNLCWINGMMISIKDILIIQY